MRRRPGGRSVPARVLAAAFVWALLPPPSVPAQGGPEPAPTERAEEAGVYRETGLASWYGGKFQGRPTASGEIFDTERMTAAHKSLPFGTMVTVTDLVTGRSAVVRINDRGPFVEGRIIDLSRAAAREIGLLERGVGRVRIEAAGRTGLTSGRTTAGQGKADGASAGRTVQVASYREKANADRTIARLREAGFSPVLEVSPEGAYRVLLEPVPETEIDRVQERLRRAGFDRILVRTR